MQKLVYMILVGSLALAAVGCGASSFHSPATPFAPAPAPGTAGKLGGEAEGVSAYRFAIDQKEVTEEAFNQVIEAELARSKGSLDFKTINVGEFKLTTDHKWAFVGDSALMEISGEVCKEGATNLEVKGSQNNRSRILAGSAGMTIPFRMGKTHTLLEMPTTYADPLNVVTSGTPKLQPAEAGSTLTSLLTAANKDVSLNVKVEDRKITLTVLKPTGPSQYLAIQADYTATACVAR